MASPPRDFVSNGKTLRSTPRASCPAPNFNPSGRGREKGDTGNREVRQMDEAYNYGYNNTRDASTLTPRKQVEPLVIADDITNLPSMHGFAKFPDGFPAARILLEWKDYPQIAQGFMSRSDVQPVRSRRGEEAFEEDGAGEAGGRDGAGQIVEEVAETGSSDDRSGGKGCGSKCK